MQRQQNVLDEPHIHQIIQIAEMRHTLTEAVELLTAIRFLFDREQVLASSKHDIPRSALDKFLKKVKK